MKVRIPMPNGFIAPPPPKDPLSQNDYDIIFKVTEAVWGKGSKPYCRVCLADFDAGTQIGWSYSKTMGNYIGVHLACHNRPLGKDITPEERRKCEKARRRICKEPCICDTDVIVQSGCQCGGI